MNKLAIARRVERFIRLEDVLSRVVVVQKAAALLVRTHVARIVMLVGGALATFLAPFQPLGLLLAAVILLVIKTQEIKVLVSKAKLATIDCTKNVGVNKDY